MLLATLQTGLVDVELNWVDLKTLGRQALAQFTVGDTDDRFGRTFWTDLWRTWLIISGFVRIMSGFVRILWTRRTACRGSNSLT